MVFYKLTEAGHGEDDIGHTAMTMVLKFSCPTGAGRECYCTLPSHMGLSPPAISFTIT